MRGLIVLVIALGTLWGGYWVVGSIALQRSADGWFDAQSAASGVASRASITVQGFPNRFDVIVDKPHLSDPKTGYGWDAEFAQVFSMTWKPWHLIFALPNEQHFTTPDDVVTVASKSMDGSVVFVPGTKLQVNRVVVEGADLAVTSRLGWVIKAAKAQMATRPFGADGKGYEINLSVAGLTPDPGLMAALQGKSDLPASVEVVSFDVTAALSSPVYLNDAGPDPQVLGMEIRDGQIRWGDLVVTTSGAVTEGADGLAEGRIDIHVENWRKMLPVAVAMGLITAEVAPTVENMMGLMAQQKGDGTALDLPLMLKAGRMSLGPIPLGAAPRMTRAAQG
jgi:hypothetical protein